MKGKIFAEKPTDPCPHCKTPRIEVDADDDYCVYPGRIIPATCECQDCRQATSWTADCNKKYPEPFMCSSCEHKVSWTKERGVVRNQWRRESVWYRFVSSCEFSRPRIERLEGCEKCSTSASWPGLHDE